MKQRLFIYSAFSIVTWLLHISIAQAQNSRDIQLGLPVYAGTGCPIGSVAATLSPDANALSILFDKYSAESGGTSRKQTDRKACDLAIPVYIPQGYTVAILNIDYRGFHSLPEGARAEFGTEYSFGNVRGPSFQKTFLGPTEEEYYVANSLNPTGIIWSACGGTINLKTYTYLMNQTNTAQEQTLSTLDSVDLNAGIVYKLQWKRCSEPTPTPVPTPPASTNKPKMQILSATFGGNVAIRTRGNATAEVARHCAMLNSCEYTVDTQAIGDPAPGSAKDLVVEYQCDGENGLRRLYLQAPVKSGMTAKMACAQTWTAPGTPMLQVTRATYGGNVRSELEGNATRDTATVCNGKARCDYQVSTWFLGDPAYGSAKNYVVEYTCSHDGRARKTVLAAPVANGATAILSCF